MRRASQTMSDVHSRKPSTNLTKPKDQKIPKVKLCFESATFCLRPRGKCTGWRYQVADAALWAASKWAGVQLGWWRMTNWMQWALKTVNNDNDHYAWPLLIIYMILSCLPKSQVNPRRDLHATLFSAPSFCSTMCGLTCDHSSPRKQCHSEEAAGTDWLLVHSRGDCNAYVHSGLRKAGTRAWEILGGCIWIAYKWLLDITWTHLDTVEQVARCLHQGWSTAGLIPRGPSTKNWLTKACRVGFS